jgi:hypothetical protein
MTEGTLTKAKVPLRARAQADAEGLAHDIAQTLRVTGCDPLARGYAPLSGFLPALWKAVRANAETRAFEEACDRLRAEAVHAAAGMERLSVLGQARLGESQACQAESALFLYHYLDAKLLLLVSSAALALESPGAASSFDRSGACGELIERGAPPRMPPMELVDERGADQATRRVFADIRRTLAVDEVPGDYRSLALWPRYLSVAWGRLKPVVAGEGHGATCRRLTELSRALASRLPHPVPLSAEALAGAGLDVAAAAQRTLLLERALAPLVLNVALLALDWQAPELARRSPYPARPRRRDGEA